MSPHATAHCLRDCQAWHDVGLPLATASNEAAKLYDAAVSQLVSWREDEKFGGLSGTCAKMQAADPSFVMGKAFELGLQVMSRYGLRSRELDPALAKQLDELEQMTFQSSSSAISLSDREAKHVRAVLLCAEGNKDLACDVWESILIDHPTDVLALRYAFDSYFSTLGTPRTRDCVARVMPNWNKSMPLFNYVKSMYAFGLEECNLYPQAEKEATEALEMNRHDAWATHVMAHVYEMENRTSEGIRFLESTEENWLDSKFVGRHNHWHLCLYYLEKGDYDKTLELLDSTMTARTNSGMILDIVDMVSLLYRLKMENVPLSKERWQLAAQLCQSHINDHVWAFNDTHFMMAFSAAGRQDLVKEFQTSIDEFGKQPQTRSDRIIANYGCKIASGIVAFEDEDYDRAVELLYPIRSKFWKLGASHAQRDVFDQLLVNSALLSKTKRREARVLLNERQMQRPDWKVTERMLQRFLRQHEHRAAIDVLVPRHQ